MNELANSNKNVEGLMSYAAWDKTCDVNHVAMADYSWSFSLVGEPDDYRENYAYRLFPNNKKLAKRAFSMYSAINRVCGGIFGNLAYYNYSYYNFDKDYPRNFPGEAMKEIFDDREKLEAQLHKISKFTDEAYKVFEKLRSDLSGDYHMARRYSSEVRNRRDIVNDYIALLEIDSIVKSGDKDANKKVAKIAGARRKCRLELLAEMEDFKEEYLHASHLRNQSIFMQLFADIEVYAKKTPAEEFTLDVCDLRGIASDMMNTLR